MGVDFGAHAALTAVDLTVGAAGVLGLIGPNGSGKTTLLRTILGAQSPARGRVTIDGVEVARLRAAELARRISAVLQEEVPELPLSVWDTVLLGRSVHRPGWQRYGPDDTRIALAALERTGARALAERSVLELSGGERQRVLIARALAQQAPYLVLDEPTNHLDVRYQHELLGLVAGLGTSTVVVLHDLNLAARYCDELVLLDRGAIAARGTPSDVLVPEVLEPVYGIGVRRVDDGGVPQLTFAPQSR